ncbi:7422_t:CDS:2, partial [Cetraspora pellucida]
MQDDIYEKKQAGSQFSPINTVILLSRLLLTSALSLVSQFSSKSLLAAIRNSLLFIETMSKLQMCFGQSANVKTSFSITHQSNNILLPLLQLSPISKSDLSLPLPQLFLISISDLLLSNKIVKLQICLDEINHQCSITKSLNTPTYDYLHLLSISRYIELLLNGKGKIDASTCIAKIIWNKRSYLARHIRKLDDHYVQTRKLLVDHQGKHTKLKSLIKNIDFSDACQAWLHQQKPESRSLEKKNEDLLCSKHPVRSIMVSAFLCLCHGLLQLSDKQMIANSHIKYKEIFVLRSTQLDGYWKSEHMLKQLEEHAIPIFEVLHPGCIGVFCFDQSTNHNAMAENALVATKINLGSRGLQPKMCNGWYFDEDGEKQIQSMLFPDNYHIVKYREQPKGIKQVLTKHGLWPLQGVRLQPDFCEQKSMLEESYVKQETRKLYKYSYFDLQQQVLRALVNVPITTIHLKGRTAKWAINKYKSHHRLSENIERIMDSDI